MTCRRSHPMHIPTNIHISGRILRMYRNYIQIIWVDCSNNHQMFIFLTTSMQIDFTAKKLCLYNNALSLLLKFILFMKLMHINKQTSLSTDLLLTTVCMLLLAWPHWQSPFKTISDLFRLFIYNITIFIYAYSNVLWEFMSTFILICSSTLSFSKCRF